MEIHGLFALAQFCVNAPFDAPVCRDFWFWVFVAFISILALVLFFLIKRVVSHVLKVRAAIAEQERRDAIDYDAIDAHRWKEDAELVPGAESGQGSER